MASLNHFEIMNLGVGIQFFESNGVLRFLRV
jgi:hypothetical protein